MTPATLALLRAPFRTPRLRAAAALIALAAFTASAQQPIAPAPVDPGVAAALAKVSPDRIQADIAKLVTFNNRSTLSSLDTDLPPNTGVIAASDWIFAEFNRISAACNNCLEVHRDDFIEPPQVQVPGAAAIRITKPTRIVNIYAVLKGADPAQTARRVLVTGHYDSRNTTNANTHDPAPGANDDASGVAVSLECARVLTSSGLHFPSSLVFVAVAGEEQGLNGSAHLARLAKSEGWQLEAVLNNDIVGGDTTPGQAASEDKSAVRVFSEGVPAPATIEQLHAIQTTGAESDSPSRELARAIADVATTYFAASEQHAPPAAPGHARSHLVQLVPAFHPVLIFRRDRFLRGGDHSSFNAQGFAAVRFTEWRENFDHQHQDVRVAPATSSPDASSGPSGQMVQFGDLLQFVDFAYVANVARLNAATLATLALAPGTPQNVHVATSNLDNNTKLTWEAPAGFPSGATYEIVWRDTTAPLWTTSQSAGTATSITLPISKDNVVFGVRTVDRAGHRSVAVYPTPTRSPSFPQPGPAAK